MKNLFESDFELSEKSKNQNYRRTKTQVRISEKFKVTLLV